MAYGPEPGQHPQPRDTHCAWKGYRAVVQFRAVVQYTALYYSTDMYCTTEVNTEAFRVM